MGAWALAGPRQALWEREEPSPEADLRCRSWSAPRPREAPSAGRPPAAGRAPAAPSGQPWSALAGPGGLAENS